MKRDERTDIRFYMDTWLAAELTRKAEPTKNEIATIPASTISHISHEMLDTCCNDVARRTMKAVKIASVPLMGKLL